MPPVYVKGGMWTNVEDEILKAAIAKYGLNQWSRVSSLLTRKNAKQCKLRWNEWLDPRIKKLDWSPDEDKQLLNLAKLRPNQWTSIAMFLKRTANQCIERYQELLTGHLGDGEGEGAFLVGNVESGEAKGTSAFSGLNLNPESKPARPDLEVMDEDEKEMISEARARLANTQGKKAKRKARERVLEESRRVAELLRRRDLKQVGIDAKLRPKKTFKEQMDYNADIAFERRPEKGPFDTSEEVQLNEREKVLFDRNTQVKGTFNQEVEAQKRKEKKRKEHNKRLVEYTQSKRKRDEEDDENEELYAKEMSKRRRLDFNTPGSITDLDDIVEDAVQDLDARKSIVLSRKKDVISSFDISKAEKKEEKKRIKEQRKHLHSLLDSLPTPDDDFDFDVEMLENDEMVQGDSTKKPRLIAIDKNEQRRVEIQKRKLLLSQINELVSPQVAKRKNLPLIKSASVSGLNDEAKLKLLDIIKGRLPDYHESTLEELKAHISAWEEVERRTEQCITEDGRYDNIETKVELPNHELIKMIKSYTEESSKFEADIKDIFNRDTDRDVVAKILNCQSELEQIENEIWTNEEIYKLEREYIDSRKSQLQASLDKLNCLING
ncbi:hypothetical protein CAS74_001675 [Pichia kudriavzevii]|uniref:Pre-mRNA-splicing factor CEF1 n=2 Tax=Pichia kudriavzevii TaxID=4909 RepID=A0A1Z8JRX5_PICKU|nr:uncharacterized protein C5L36_0A04700 [Pichia kudriavzevii]AWU73872.1 hypothetical protein C5L36_0A04700 [Pichia kudriavzevii]OUT23357.1 hypothetical protein CAS74_001675 [Pichia kudriavzevii]